MLTIYLNTTENLFLDAAGDGFPEKSPELSVGGKEEIRIFLKKETPDWGTPGASPGAWQADTSWSKISGVSAMLTVDDDYQKYTKGRLVGALSEGAESLMATFTEADVEDIQKNGTLRIFSSEGDIESIAYAARSVNGSEITFVLESAVTRSYAEGMNVDCTTSPLAQAYLSAAKSNWQTGELVFDLVLDSARLRAENDYKNQANVNIQGIELLLFANSDGNVQILRSFLLDTASLRNVQGNPGFSAPVPDPMRNTISAEVGRQIEGVVDRVTPEISAGGTWLIDGVDTGKPSTGLPGQPGVAAGFGDPVINLTTGDPGTQASGTISASGPDTAKVFTFDLTIPQGRQGEQGAKGDPMKIDATGVSSDLSQYDAEPKSFSFLATDTGMVYIKNSNASGDWSDPVGFQGPAGYTPVKGTDYWTESDIAEIKSYVDEAIINGEW